MKNILLMLILLFGPVRNTMAAIGCDLNDPDRDVKRLFPESTGYKTTYMSINKLGGEALLKEVERRLGDEFHGLYETIDVPYTIYTIFREREIIGYIHGINQKGLYGGLQVFLGYDVGGTITNFYYQKLTSRKAAEMRSTNFTKQFVGLSSTDFEDYNPKTNSGGSEKVSAIKNPNAGDTTDFNATLRAVKKNLILTHIFVFGKEGREK
ncbi:MAG: hypothetical protein LBS34_03030 [Rickettsiales bacterium]|jgi:hypothetical protein|nr:hypothetical protein [Rickettsiales bacterium]